MQRYAPGRRAAGAGSSCRCRSLTPGLSRTGSAWSPRCRAAIARPLVGVAAARGGLRTSTTSPRYVPDPPGGLIGFDDARRAGAAPRCSDADVATRWSIGRACPARRATRCRPTPTGRAAALYTDRRERDGRRPAEALWRVIEGIGGEQRLVLVPARLGGARLAGPAGRRGGAAARPTRPAPAAGRRRAGLLAGRGDRAGPAAAAARRDAAARAGLAGAARRAATATGRSRYRQRALFHPRGLAGHAYWWSVAPFHGVVFGGMARNIADHAPTR